MTYVNNNLTIYPDSFDAAAMLMYQKRRDDSRFDHITTQQRGMWEMVCYHRTEEQKKLYHLAFNYGAIQQAQEQMKKIMAQVQEAKSSDEARVLLAEAQTLETQLEQLING